MRQLAVRSRGDFDTIRTAVNRWRTENAPQLTRDEVVLLMLGQWLSSQGYLHAETGDSLAPSRAATHRPTGAPGPAHAGPGPGPPLGFTSEA